MPKGKFLSDTFEQLGELAKSTVKESVKSVVGSFSPLNLLEFATRPSGSLSHLVEEKIKKPETSNLSTPLDFNSLSETYKKQDEKKEEEIKRRLHQQFHQRWKSEEASLYREKRRQQEEKQKEAQIQIQKQKEKETRSYEQNLPEPQGKKRRSIFTPKKIAQQNRAEVRPASGKH